MQGLVKSKPTTYFLTAQPFWQVLLTQMIHIWKRALQWSKNELPYSNYSLQNSEGESLEWFDIFGKKMKYKDKSFQQKMSSNFRQDLEL